MIYKLDKFNIVIRTTDGASIPMDERNKDYQEYLKWLDEGNTPEPVDAPDPRIAITEQIDRLERESLLNRGTREMQIFQLEERAAQVATQTGHPVEAVLAANVYYVKLKALDTLISGLRDQL